MGWPGLHYLLDSIEHCRSVCTVRLNSKKISFGGNYLRKCGIYITEYLARWKDNPKRVGETNQWKNEGSLFKPHLMGQKIEAILGLGMTPNHVESLLILSINLLTWIISELSKSDGTIKQKSDQLEESLSELICNKVCYFFFWWQQLFQNGLKYALYHKKRLSKYI